jgi:lysine 2,3-aminomutase
VAGAGHFRTPVAKGIEIIEGLRGHTSGYAVPTFVVDAPGGGGKIPLMPNYQVSTSDHRVVLRNYEGYITSYEEPLEYEPHDPQACPACRSARDQAGQGGVSALLSGHARVIKPEGFDELHARKTPSDSSSPGEEKAAPASLRKQKSTARAAAAAGEKVPDQS